MNSKKRIRTNFLLRLPVLANRFLHDYEMFYGPIVERCEDSSILSLGLEPISSLEVDLNIVPESVAVEFFLYSLFFAVRLSNNDFMWLKGTLSMKLNLKHARLLDLLKSGFFPALPYEMKGFILRIPIIGLQNWFEQQSNYSDPEIATILQAYRSNFDLDSGGNDPVFHLLRAIELIARQEVCELATPLNQQMDLSEMTSKLRQAENEMKKRKKSSTSLREKLKSIRHCPVCCLNNVLKFMNIERNRRIATLKNWYKKKP